MRRDGKIMNKKFIKCNLTKPLATVIIDRPEVLNAYHDQLLDELDSVLSKVFSNQEIKAVIITGKGSKAFSVGGDIEWLEEFNGNTAKEMSRKGHKICNMIENSAQVVIAAIDGYAIGGGLEITLACDMRFATTRSRMGQPEVKLGIVPGFGGTQRLPRLIGLAKAKEMLFTGNIIDATVAHEIGLINKVVTPRSLLPIAREIAMEITDRSSQAVSMIKNAINLGYEDNIAAGYQYETKAFGICFENEDHHQRISKIKQIIKDG